MSKWLAFEIQIKGIEGLKESMEELAEQLERTRLAIKGIRWAEVLRVKEWTMGLTMLEKFRLNQILENDRICMLGESSVYESTCVQEGDSDDCVGWIDK
jgi:hypothetical protein